MVRPINAKSASQKINRERGKVVSNFAYIESLITGFIASSYFKVDEPAQLNVLKNEILDDKYFSFEFKKQIFYKILLSRFPQTNKLIPNRELERLQTLRNIFAHGLPQGEIVSAKPGSLQNISLMHRGKPHHLNDIIKEYESLRKIVQPALEKLPGLTVTPYN